MKARATIVAPAILHRGSLLTYRDNRAERCLGYLFVAPGRGVFEPTFGRLEVSEEEAHTHNQLLSAAEVAGLDTNCAIGLGGNFYTRREAGKTIVITWLGNEVSRDVQINRGKILFRRNGMTFAGTLRREEDCFFFRRIG